MNSFRHLQVNSQLVRGNYLIAELDGKIYTVNIDRGTVRETKLKVGKEVSVQEAYKLITKAIGRRPVLRHFITSPGWSLHEQANMRLIAGLKEIIENAVDGNLRDVAESTIESKSEFIHIMPRRVLKLGSVLDAPAFKPTGSESLTGACNRAREQWKQQRKTLVNEIEAAKESCRAALDDLINSEILSDDEIDELVSAVDEPQTYCTGERIMDVSKATTVAKPQTLDEVCKVSQARWEYARANKRVARLKEYAEAIATAPSKDDIKLMDIIDECIGNTDAALADNFNIAETTLKGTGIANKVGSAFANALMSVDCLALYRELHADARKYDIGRIIKKKDGEFTTLDKESDESYAIFNRQDGEETIIIEFSFLKEIGYITYELVLLKLESGKLEVVSIGSYQTKLGRLGLRIPHFSVANLMSLWHQVCVGDIIEPKVLMVQTV